MATKEEALSMTCFLNTHSSGGIVLPNGEKEKKTACKQKTGKVSENWFLKYGSLLISVLALIGTFTNSFVTYGRYSEKVDRYGKDIEEMQKNVSEIQNDIQNVSTQMSALAARADSAERDVNRLYQDVFAYRPTSIFAASITKTYSGVDVLPQNGIVTVGATTKIVYSKNIHGREYTPAQLADQPLLLPYTDDGKEVYFYGQVDENGCWDGHCIVNIYKNNQLNLITDAQYENGKLLVFRQAFPDSLPNGDDIWAISDRTMRNGYSEGETWRYFRDGNCTKEFTPDTVSPADILSVDAFKTEYADTVEGCYHGNVSGGSYNDDTGDAYYVQYFRDGTVETLYVGRFVQGNFEDLTGGAWMLGKESETAPYSYYKGIFKKGKATKTGKCWEDSLTIDRVREIVAQSGIGFSCTLKWEQSRV